MPSLLKRLLHLTSWTLHSLGFASTYCFLCLIHFSWCSLNVDLSHCKTLPKASFSFFTLTFKVILPWHDFKCHPYAYNSQIYFLPNLQIYSTIISNYGISNLKVQDKTFDFLWSPSIHTSGNGHYLFRWWNQKLGVNPYSISLFTFHTLASSYALLPLYFKPPSSLLDLYNVHRLLLSLSNSYSRAHCCTERTGN